MHNVGGLSAHSFNFISNFQSNFSMEIHLRFFARKFEKSHAAINEQFNNLEIIKPRRNFLIEEARGMKYRDKRRKIVVREWIEPFRVSQFSDQHRFSPTERWTRSSTMERSSTIWWRRTKIADCWPLDLGTPWPDTASPSPGIPSTCRCSTNVSSTTETTVYFTSIVSIQILLSYRFIILRDWKKTCFENLLLQLADIFIVEKRKSR